MNDRIVRGRKLYQYHEDGTDGVVLALGSFVEEASMIIDCIVVGM